MTTIKHPKYLKLINERSKEIQQPRVKNLVLDLYSSLQGFHLDCSEWDGPRHPLDSVDLGAQPVIDFKPVLTGLAVDRSELEDYPQLWQQQQQLLAQWIKARGDTVSVLHITNNKDPNWAVFKTWDFYRGLALPENIWLDIYFINYHSRYTLREVSVFLPYLQAILGPRPVMDFHFIDQQLARDHYWDLTDAGAHLWASMEPLHGSTVSTVS